MKITDEVKIVEVGPRDGLQNESKTLSIEDRQELIQKLIASGLKFLEGGSFVSPKAIPQLTDSEKVWSGLQNEKVDLSFLVPNLKGLERAVSSNVKSVAVFTATSDLFNQKNIGMTVAESLQVIKEIVEKAKTSKLRVRGYISTAFGCPYEGYQDPLKVVALTTELLEMGCDEVSIGDTIGVAHPRQVEGMLALLSQHHEFNNIALHFHDTRGMALLNIKTALDRGIRIFDSSIGGLGGCPYARGSSGNVATEEVVWVLEGLGFKTGIQIEKLLEVAAWIEQKVERPLNAKLYLSKPSRLYYLSA